jgi:DNA-binding response OmpR family regulator
MERTLDSHIKNLRKKIEPDPKNPTYLQTVYGVGYRFERVPPA